ncbi:flagellar motor switch protein FliM [Neokomagataea thailandica NBRC 106555]|uniref:Flagellar motor switch protein FliM n=2 Tax=Neokomagataea TaxID=1223423 RepID=A0A4Y6V8R7_9PROT|nr:MULTISPECIES: flagellar motor switch protein FliM [Neokomagataea]QDH24877.1 flagellar motor switch protein FliM [Neokomagataea tanensis]GBR51089.1 flagellar motor switch protein FliM [Neokomagataea thailandica NBRC 106555]
MNEEDTTFLAEAASEEMPFPRQAISMDDFDFGEDDEDEGRILNQAEIDSLFGGDASFQGGERDDTGLTRLISSSHVSYERLPMLEVVFDRLLRIFTTSLRNFTSDNVELSMDRLGSQRFGDYLDNVSPRSTFVVFKAEEWDGYGILVLSSSLVYSVVDSLMGGRDRGQAIGAAQAAERQEGRHHTAIERALVEPLVRMILSDLSTSFSPLCAINFRFERLELNPRFATISRAANGVVMARFGIDMDGQGGDVDLILPHATLEPVREILLQQFMGEKFGHDGIWENHLAQELWQTDITFDAVLEEQVMQLSDIVSLAPGDQLIIRRNPEGKVRLCCGEKTLFHGRVGKKQGNVAVCIEEVLIGRESKSNNVNYI